MSGEGRASEVEPTPHRRPDRPPLAFSTSGRPRTPAPEAPSDSEADWGMPARPQIDEPPPPLRASPIERPKMLWVSVLAWIASFVMGLGAIALTLVHGNKVRAELATKVHNVRPSLDQAGQKAVADTLLSASAVAGAILVVVQLLFVHRLWARRRRSRIALFVLGAVNLLILFLFQDALADSVGLRHSNERINAIGHGLMIAFAMVTMLWPTVGRWVRRTSAYYDEEYDQE